MIKAILIDDELNCLNSLNMLISDFCPEVQVDDLCRSGKKALESIERLKPELVFLDIEMPLMNGFELLEHFKQILPFKLGHRHLSTTMVYTHALNRCGRG